MTKSSKILATLVLIIGMVTAHAWAAGGKVRGEKAVGPAGDNGYGAVSANRGDGTCDSCPAAGILSETDAEHLLYMIQEEKLARDVYQKLYELYGDDESEPLLVRIFENISASEQRHMDAIKRLILKYGLENPVEEYAVGEFPDPEEAFADFNELYDDLLFDGMAGYCEALDVGRKIEELDIYDLEATLSGVADENGSAVVAVEASDVARVFLNLQKGSYNHLNAFSNQIELLGCDTDTDFPEE